MSAWVWLKDTNKLDMNFLFNPPHPANMKSIYLFFKKGDIFWQKLDMNFCLIPTLCQKWKLFYIFLFKRGYFLANIMRLWHNCLNEFWRTCSNSALRIFSSHITKYLYFLLKPPKLCQLGWLKDTNRIFMICLKLCQLGFGWKTPTS